MRIGIEFLASLAVLILVQAGTAEAQASDQSGLCSGKTTGAAPAVRVAACTALINSGKYSGKNMAILYNNRCSWNATVASDPAINDCSQAIRMDPGYARPYYNRSLAYYNKKGL
jgi:hypothetical protein